MSSAKLTCTGSLVNTNFLCEAVWLRPTGQSQSEPALRSLLIDLTVEVTAPVWALVSSSPECLQLVSCSSERCIIGVWINTIHYPFPQEMRVFSRWWYAPVDLSVYMQVVLSLFFHNIYTLLHTSVLIGVWPQTSGSCDIFSLYGLLKRRGVNVSKHGPVPNIKDELR